MKGKELIEIIKDRNLEEFEIKISVLIGFSTFPDIESYQITGLDDIGYSDKVAIFGGEKIEN